MREMGGMRDWLRSRADLDASIQAVSGFGQDILRIRVLTLRIAVSRAECQAGRWRNNILRLIWQKSTRRVRFMKTDCQRQ